MANKHETLVSLFTDIADAIREKNGKNSVTEVLLPEITAEATAVVDGIYEIDATHLFPFPLSIGMEWTNDCIVTINNISYRCSPWMTSYGEPRLGNSQLEQVPDYQDDHPENVPFLVGYYEGWDGSTWPEEINTWWFYIDFSEPGTYTVKIDRIISEAEPIIADDFPDEILNIQTKEDLEAELTEQERLLEELETALSGKAIPEVNEPWVPETQKLTVSYSCEAGPAQASIFYVGITENGEVCQMSEVLPGGTTEYTILKDSLFVFEENDGGGMYMYEYNYIPSDGLGSICDYCYYILSDDIPASIAITASVYF